MKITNQKHISTLINDVLQDLDSINLSYPNEILFKDIRAARTHGWCRQANPKISKEKGFKFIIGISIYIKHDKDIKNTIMHEILHAVVMNYYKEASPHGKEWKTLAKLVNQKLDYNITRCANLELTIKPKRRKRRKVRYRIIFI